MWPWTPIPPTPDWSYQTTWRVWETICGFRIAWEALYEWDVSVQVWCGDQHQMLPDNQERFDRVICVLGKEMISSGKHYWEVRCSRHKNLPLPRLSTSAWRTTVWGIIFEQVDVTGKTDWDLGVARKSVNRKGKITVTPSNGYWFLSLRDTWDRFNNHMILD